MGVAVTAFDAPGDALAVAGQFLTADPIRHNLILTLLQSRVAHPRPGRYWVAEADGRCAGVGLQSPLHFIAAVTPMTDEVTDAVADAIADSGAALAGVAGVAGTAARFAGRWSERVRCSIVPSEGQRIYEVKAVTTPAGVPGHLRPAGESDRELLVQWIRAFGLEVGGGGHAEEAVAVVARRLASGDFWIWDEAGPAAMAGLSPAQAGVVRIGPVFTPADRRRRGFASALVGALSQAVLDQSRRCILYADLSNPVSNSIYRRMGYQAVAEVLRYDFRPLSA